LASILLAGLPASPALALDEADRLWLVGDRAFADGLYPVARRVLDRFVIEYPNDTRVAPAMLLLGRSRLALGEPEKALDAFRRLRATLPAQQPWKAASGKPSRSIA
jgi:TolA-binding protein